MLKKILFTSIFLLVIILLATKLHGNIMPKKFYNLTALIKENLVVYPGEPPIKIKKFLEIDEQHVAALSSFDFLNHIGTHADFPSHVIKGGKTSSDFPLKDLVDQPGVIIEVPHNDTSITKAFLEKEKKLLKKGSIVFFKTKNSDIPKTQDKLDKNFVSFEPDAAEILVKAGVKAVGIDYLSVDKFQNSSLPVHKELLANNILIVENLELKEIPQGTYLISIVPMQIEHIDGAPVTVYATSK